MASCWCWRGREYRTRVHLTVLSDHRVYPSNERKPISFESGATLVLKARKRRGIAVVGAVAAHRVKVAVQREAALTVHWHELDGAVDGARATIARSVGLIDVARKVFERAFGVKRYKELCWCHRKHNKQAKRHDFP